MVTLYNAETGAVLGTISEAALVTLQDNLEEEVPEDHDYWINPATVDLLAERGADPALVDLLRSVVGENEEGVEIAFAREGEERQPLRRR
jgi:hypothetical protein